MAFWFVKKRPAAAAGPPPEAPPGPPPPDDESGACKCSACVDGAEHMFQTRRLKSIEMIKTYRMNFYDDIDDEQDSYYGTCQRDIYYPPHGHGHQYHHHQVAPPPPPPPVIRHVPAARALPAPHQFNHFHCGPPPPQAHHMLPPPHAHGLMPPPPPQRHFAPSRGHFAPPPPDFDCYGHF